MPKDKSIVTLTSYVPAKLKAEVDAAAKKSRLSTSRYIEFALKVYLSNPKVS